MSKYIDLDNVEFLKVDGNKEFNHGVDVCINTLLKQERVTAIPIDKVKQAREEIQKLRGCSCSCSDGIIDDVEEILDKLIESEGQHD